MSALRTVMTSFSNQIHSPRDTPYKRSKSVGSEAPITFLSEFRPSTRLAAMASVSLNDAQDSDREQLDEGNTMNPEEDWIYWAGKLDTTGLISSSLFDGAGLHNPCDATMNWSSTDPWAGAGAEECTAIAAPDQSSQREPSDHVLFPNSTPKPKCSLSFEEEARLLRIAMPSYAPPISPPHSVSSSPTRYKNEPQDKHHKRKKKQSTPSDAVWDEITYEPLPPSLPTPPIHTQAKKKRRLSSSDHRVQSKSHNATEKKYRCNLNDKLAILRLCVPSLCAPIPAVPSEKSPSSGGDDDDNDNSDKCSDGGDGGGGSDGKRCTKATIIAKATEYILAQEQDSKRLRADVAVYQSRIAAFEALEQAGVLWSSSAALWRSAAAGDAAYDEVVERIRDILGHMDD